MKCCSCGEVAKYYCECSVPNTFICERHLASHNATKGKHLSLLVKDISDLNLYRSALDRVNSTKFQIFKNLKELIDCVKSQANQALSRIEALSLNLNEMHSKNSIDDNFITDLIMLQPCLST